MSELKKYTLGTHTAEQWPEIYELLTTEDTNNDGIPDRLVSCEDDKVHSPTRGTFLLSDEEAEDLKNHPSIKFIHLDLPSYPEQFKAPPDQLVSASPAVINRYNTSVKNYKQVSSLPTTPGAADYNRAGYQLLRTTSQRDPWSSNAYNSTAILNRNIQLQGTGENIDVIVTDDGCWFGHPEFQSNTNTPTPANFIGGNPLPGNGTCMLLDLLLDAPYYIDPDWFDADPSNRLITRWDGTIVPDELEALRWWAFTANRSTIFQSYGTVNLISSGYTRARNNGSNTARSTYGQHGTACASLTYGRSLGWAYNANKWFLQNLNYFGTDIEPSFDLVKLFHQMKPINEYWQNKNPTITSNSWGYRATKGSNGDYYHFRGSSVQYGGQLSEPAFIAHMGLTGDGGRWKSEMKYNSMVQAGEEMLDAGVIMIVAAGNSNQKLVSSDHPDFNNYIAAGSGTTLEDSRYYEFGLETTGTTNRRGFPQQLGKYFDPDTGIRIHPVIQIGALDDAQITSPIRERKVNYSDRGNDIDIYAPADGTIAANHSYSNLGRHPATYPGFTYNGGIAYDCAFGGTSAACPVAAGFIATVLEHNRGWTWRDIRSWLSTLDIVPSSQMYYGTESTSATSSNWYDYESLEGGVGNVLYRGNITISNELPPDQDTPDSTAVTTLSRGNIRFRSGVTLKLR